MDWYKHSSKEHKSKIIKTLINEVGHVGPVVYYALIEMCVDSVRKPKERPLDENDMIFEIDGLMLASCAHTKHKIVIRCLDVLHMLSIIDYYHEDMLLIIKIPMLLKSFTYDQIKSGFNPDAKAPKNRNSNRNVIEYKKENITKEKTLQQVVGDSGCGVFTLDKEVSTQDIELLYAKYPRKEGKTKGMQKLQKQIKTKQDLADLAKAIEVYSKLSAGKEKQFIKHFATFASCWKDYLQEGIESDAEVVDENEILLSKFTAKLGDNYE